MLTPTPRSDCCSELGDEVRQPRRACSLPQLVDAAESGSRAERFERLLPYLDKRKAVFSRLDEMTRQVSVLDMLVPLQKSGDLVKLRATLKRAKLDEQLCSLPIVHKMSTIVSRADHYCTLCEKVVRKMAKNEFSPNGAHTLTKAVWGLKQLELGPAIWKETKSSPYPLLPRIYEMLHCLVPLHLLTEAFFEAERARATCLKQERKLATLRKEQRKEEQKQRAAAESGRKIAKRIVAFANEHAASEAAVGAKAAARAAEAEAAEAKMFKLSEQIAKTAAAEEKKVKARTATHTAQMCREAEDCKKAVEKAMAQVAAAAETVVTEEEVERQLATVANFAEVNFCAAWLDCVQTFQLTPQLAQFTGKWFARLPEAEVEIRKLLERNEVRIVYPGIAWEQREEALQEAIEQMDLDPSIVQMSLSAPPAGIDGVAFGVVGISDSCGSYMLAVTRKVEFGGPCILGSNPILETVLQKEARVSALLGLLSTGDEI